MWLPPGTCLSSLSHFVFLWSDERVGEIEEFLWDITEIADVASEKKPILGVFVGHFFKVLKRKKESLAAVSQ